MLAKEERKHFNNHWDWIGNGVSDIEVSNIFFPKSSLMRFRSRLIITFPADNLPFMLAERGNYSIIQAWGFEIQIMAHLFSLCIINPVIVVINILGVLVIGWILNSFSYRKLVDFLSLPCQEW